MDTTVAGALSTALTTFKGDAMTQLGTVLPLAIGVAITVGVLFFGIKLFRSIAHV